MVQSGEDLTEGEYRTALNDALGRPIPLTENLRVWLDDDLLDRRAPDGWIHLRSAREVCLLLLTGRVIALSLDNDLDGDIEFGTGFQVVDFLDERQGVAGEALWPREGITIHSANSSGRDRMTRAIESLPQRHEGLEVESSLTSKGKRHFDFPSAKRS